jgi:beta-galactosidase GanA
MALLLPLALAAALAAPARGEFVTYDAFAGAPYSVSYEERAFTVNGTRTLLLGGSFHPPRIAFGDWARLLAEAKADGLNHVQVYVFWNYHERSRGEYAFTPNTRSDLAGFFELAGKAGLFVNVRIGPYVCAEWNGGGFPLWLKHVSNFTCSRCSDPVWEAEMKRFVVKVADVMEPYLARKGGPIIMAQIENELHSPPGDPYVTWCGALAAELALDIPWIMCNGASASNTVNTCNGNSCGTDGGYADTHAMLFPGQPLAWTEDWSWFTTWGGTVTNHPASYMARNIAQWFAKGGSHHNYYVRTASSGCPAARQAEVWSRVCFL